MYEWMAIASISRACLGYGSISDVMRGRYSTVTVLPWARNGMGLNGTFCHAVSANLALLDAIRIVWLLLLFS